MVSYFVLQANGATDPTLYVWDVESDQIQTFNFRTGQGQEDLDDNVISAQEQLTADIKGNLIALSLHYLLHYIIIKNIKN